MKCKNTSLTDFLARQYIRSADEGHFSNPPLELKNAFPYQCALDFFSLSGNNEYTLGVKLSRAGD
jgi:hypothetical protein